MAKLEGVKTLDMVGGQITKVEYNGAVYEKVEGDAKAGDLIYTTERDEDTLANEFYEIVLDDRYGGITFFDEADDECDIHMTFYKTFRKVSDSDLPTIEEVNAKVDELVERVDALEETKPAPTFREGDHVKALADGEDGDIKEGEVGEIIIIFTDEDYPYTIGVDTKDGFDYFRPQDLELVTYKPSEGDIVVITANTNCSRNAVGDIGKVGKVTGYDATVDVPDKPDSSTVTGNWTLFSEMRPATDEEKAKYEQAIKFEAAGRKPGEFKKGDIVRYVGKSTLNGVTLEVYEDTEDGRTKVDFRKHNYGICTEKNEELELIAPVESRVDVD